MTDREQLRRLVAEAVREAVAELRPGAPEPSGGLHAPLADGPRRRTEAVRIASDDDLAAFTRQLLQLFENPKTRQDVRNGWLRFRLEGAGQGRTASPARTQVRVDRGAITERRIVEASEAGQDLLVARGAVLTPLARDKARALGVHIEKER